MVEIDAEQITGLVLAGGRGSRMGDRDKGLELLRGYPMVMHVIARLAPQVGPMIVNANRNARAYGDLGYPVISDREPGYPGPLAGIEAGLLACATPYLVSVPCDTPYLPSDLVRRLAAALQATSAPVVTVVTQGRLQPVFCLMRVELAPELSQFLQSGARRVEAWLDAIHAVTVAFDDASEAFRNVNTLADLDAAADPAVSP